MDPEIRLQGKGFDFTIPLGEGQVRPTDGGGQVEEIPRPQRSSLTEYEGEALLRLEVPAFWDGWPRRSIQDHIDQVLGLCFARKGQLPVFKATGPMVFSGRRFQMDGLPDFLDDPEPQRSPGGALVRQALTINLVEFNDPDALEFKRDTPSHEDGHGIGPGRALIGVGQQVPLTITLQFPETLLQIAARVLHDVGRAKEIGDLNGIRDVRLKLPVGEVIKLPREG